MIIAPPLKSVQIVKASAGSGKTHRLALELLTLLLSHPYAYQKILAVTFTNKATAEMKERVMDVLEQIALGKGSEEYPDFVAHLLKVYPEHNNFSLSELAKRIYANILHDYSRFSISTIDKFVLKVIRGLTHELGIDHHFQIELNIDKILAHISQVMYDHLDNDPLLLDWFLKVAIDHLDKGKGWDFRKALESFAKNILFSDGFVSFEKRFNELNQPEILSRLNEFVNISKEEYEQALQIWVKDMVEIAKYSKINPEVFSRAKTNRFRKFWETNPSIKEADFEYYFDQVLMLGREKLASTLFKKSDLETAGHPELIDQIWNLWMDVQDTVIQKRKNKEWSDILNQSNQFLRLCIELSKHLASYRASYGILLNADATQLLAEMSKDYRENPSFIWEKMGHRYQYFLIDEFQDTSYQQWQNFLPLLDHAIATNERNHLKHLIVGDVKQSIYRWRGGDWHLLEKQVQEDIGEQNIEVETLNYNYRSQAAIIHFNNQLFSFLPEVMQSQLNDLAQELLGSEAYSKIWLAKGYDHSLKDIYAPKTTHQSVPEWREEGMGKIDLIPILVESNSHRFSNYKNDIFNLVTEQLQKWLVEEKIYQAHQIGILVRSNREAKELIEFVKQRNDNAYQLISAEAFYLKEYLLVQLIIKIFILLKEWPQQHALDLATIVQYHVTLSQPSQDLINLTATQLAELKFLSVSNAHDYLPAEFCDQVDILASLPAMELIEQLVAIFNWGDHVQNVPYLLAFREEIAKAAFQEGAGIDQFLSYWAVEQDKAKLPEGSQGDFVEVVTLHKSKGLAYDVVILPTLNWSMLSVSPTMKSYHWWKAQFPVQELEFFPIEFSLKNTSFFEEETAEEVLMQYVDALNELYVAMTRAKIHLVLYLLQESDSKKGITPTSKLISDYINLFVLDYLNPKENEPLTRFDQPISIGEAIDITQDTKSTQDYIELNQYPVVQHFNLAFTNKEILELDVLNQLPAQQIGVWMHQMLEWYFMEEDALKLLEKALKQREINENMKIYIEDLYKKTLDKNVLSDFKNRSGYEILLEQALISPKKEVFRPDILWVNQVEKQAIVLDFKFTKKKEKKHYQQVIQYKSLLINMGYLRVDAYLFYGLEEDSLIQIS